MELELKFRISFFLIGEPSIKDNIIVCDSLAIPANWFVRKCAFLKKSFNHQKK